LPIFFLVIMTFLVVFPLFYNAVECLVGLAIIATGLPVYIILVSWNNKPLVYRRFVGQWNLSFSVKGKKVKTSICIARLMYKTPLTRIYVTENRPPDRYLGHHPACKHSLGSDPITGTGNTSQLVGLHLRNPSLMDYYSFNRPRRDGWLSWPCWLTDSGRLTHKVVTRPAVSLAQDRESSPARTGGLTTMLCHQL